VGITAEPAPLWRGASSSPRAPDASRAAGNPTPFARSDEHVSADEAHAPQRDPWHSRPEGRKASLVATGALARAPRAGDEEAAIPPAASLAQHWHMFTCPCEPRAPAHARHDDTSGDTRCARERRRQRPCPPPLHPKGGLRGRCKAGRRHAVGGARGRPPPPHAQRAAPHGAGAGGRDHHLRRQEQAEPQRGAWHAGHFSPSLLLSLHRNTALQVFFVFFVSQKVFVENRTGWPGGQLFFLAKFSCLPKEGSRRRVVPSPMARLRPGAAAAGVALGAAAVALLCYVTAGPRATGGGDVDLLAAARRQGAKAYPTSVREPGEGRARARIHSRCAPPPVALAAPPSPSPPLSLCPSSPTPPPSPVS